MGHPFNAEFLASGIITLSLCSLGLLGNFLCAIVLFSKHMGRTSYIYLLQGLAISDICLLTLSLIRTMNNMGIIDLPEDEYAKGFIFFWDWISTSATKYYTVAVSMERFFVITFPLAAHAFMTSERAKQSSIGIFAFSVALSVFSYVYVNYIDANSFDIYVAVVLHFVPFVAVVTFNVLIFIGLRNMRRRAISQNSSPQGNEDDEGSVTKMLVAVVLVFGVCYSFETVRRLMNYIWPEYMGKYDYYEYAINNLSDVFYVLNSSANFVIYSVWGRNFRRVFCKMFYTWGDSKTSTLSRNGGCSKSEQGFSKTGDKNTDATRDSASASVEVEGSQNIQKSVAL